jgi:hypothetical protein
MKMVDAFAMRLAPVCVLAALAAAPLAGQRAQGAPQPPEQRPQPVPDVEMVSEREVFRYPGFQRRNPFRPLVGDEAGPRFEQIELRGIIFDRGDPNRSVVLLALRRAAAQALQQGIQQQQQQQDAGTAPLQDTLVIPDPTVRVRVGQRWGNVQVVRIEQDHVVLNVTEFGITEQRILRMTVRRQGDPR